VGEDWDKRMILIGERIDAVNAHLQKHGPCLSDP